MMIAFAKAVSTSVDAGAFLSRGQSGSDQDSEVDRVCI